MTIDHWAVESRRQRSGLWVRMVSRDDDAVSPSLILDRAQLFQ